MDTLDTLDYPYTNMDEFVSECNRLGLTGSYVLRATVLDEHQYILRHYDDSGWRYGLWLTKSKVGRISTSI